MRFVERLEGVLAVVDRLTYRFDERLADAVPGRRWAEAILRCTAVGR